VNLRAEGPRLEADSWKLKADRGATLVIALIAMFLLTTLGAALVLNSSAELAIAGNFRTSEEALYAADGAAERAMSDLQHSSDWDSVLNGASPSTFMDGSPGGIRGVAAGATVDLTSATNIANCGHPAACTLLEMTASTADRPWGLNNPFWRLYAYGPAASLVPGGNGRSSFYVVVWVADDQSETDDDPTRDGGDIQTNPGTGIIGLRAEAFGPQGAHKTLHLTLERRNGRIHIVSWRGSR
jgi:hypothetical protein